MSTTTHDSQGPAETPIERKATDAATILGRDPKPKDAKRVDLRWLKQYENLLRLRERVLEDRADLARDSIEPLGTATLHPADKATDEFDHDLALTLLSAQQDALYEVDQALERIETGTYGRCELTGELIPQARLAAIPWTRFTRMAEMSLERNGISRGAHLVGLATVREP